MEAWLLHPQRSCASHTSLSKGSTLGVAKAARAAEKNVQPGVKRLPLATAKTYLFLAGPPRRPCRGSLHGLRPRQEH